jgi:hypothetical protein
MSKKIIFCIPGNNFSVKFLRCWTNLLRELDKTDYEWDYTFHYNPEVHMARNEILGGLNRSPVGMIPWMGQRPYDYIMWIDSDIIFTPDDFFKLLEHNDPIVSGLYYRQEGSTMDDVPYKFACANLEERHLTLTDVEGKTELIEVLGNGLGFMLVKNGVFEQVGYPWFEPKGVSFMENGNEHKAFYSEDMAFQMEARSKGYRSYVDPRIIVGHEKSVILK